MSKRAEEAALKAYPTKIEELHYSDHIEMNGGLTEIDVNRFPRIYFQKGYEQAEKETIERAISWIKKNTCMGVYEQELMRKELEDEK